MLFSELQTWAPFKIDALGVVTMLGADGVNLAIGQLTQSRYTDWLPLLGAYVIANNHVAEPIPGFSLYNITDGILATDVSGWFARWLLCQDLPYSSSTIFIAPETLRRPIAHQISAVVLGLPTIVITIFVGIIGDWWGFANGISMIASVIIRQIVLGQNRCGLDRAVERAQEMSDQLVKVFMTLPNGKAITIITTRGIVVNCLLTTPRPPSPRLYNMALAMGWLVFGVHIIALGMATLFCQILSVVLLITSTFLATRQSGMDRQPIGRRLFLQRTDAKEEFRAAAYARLQLTPTEEASMVQWHLFPHKHNELWWNSYRHAQQLNNFESWDDILAKKSSPSFKYYSK